MKKQIAGRYVGTILLLAVTAVIVAYVVSRQVSSPVLPVFESRSQVNSSVAAEPAEVLEANVSIAQNKMSTIREVGNLGSGIKPAEWYTPDVSEMGTGFSGAVSEFESPAASFSDLLNTLMANPGAGPAMIDWDAVRVDKLDAEEVRAAREMIGNTGSAIKPAEWYSKQVNNKGLGATDARSEFQSLVGDNTEMLEALMAHPGTGPAMIDWQAR